MSNENILRTKIDSKQKWNGEEIQFEPDSSPNAWNHFKKYYCHLQNSKEMIYCFEELHFFNCTNNGYVDYPIRYFERLYSLPSKYEHSSETKEKGCKCFKAVARLSGEIDFNFNEKKFDEYSKKLFNNSQNEVEYKEYMNKLYRCHEMHHTLLNISLMQTMGNMQGLKSMGLYNNKEKKYEYLDRLDTFIYYLNYFYNAEDKSKSRVMKYLDYSINSNKLSKDNREVLLKYLDTFTPVGENRANIYEYCRKVYFAGISNDKTQSLVEKLIKQGKETIDSAKRVDEYMKLANEFWDIREDCFKAKDLKHKEKKEVLHSTVNRTINNGKKIRFPNHY